MPRRLTFGGAAAECATACPRRSALVSTRYTRLLSGGPPRRRGCGSPGLDDVSMLDERKAAILRAVVEEYIDTAQPVGSATSATAPGVDVSSATVRNEMAGLEAEGLPAPAPHARRADPHREGLPLLRRPPRPARPACRRRRPMQVRDVLRPGPRRARADARPDQPPAVEPHQPDRRRGRPRTRRRRRVRSVQLVRLGPTTALLVVVLADGAVEKHTLELPERHRRGAGRGGDRAPDRPPVGRAPRRARWSVPPHRRRATPTRWPIGRWPRSAERPADDPEHVFVGGTARMAQAFDAIETVREVLGILEQQFVVVSAAARRPRPGPAGGHRHRDRDGAARRVRRSWSPPTRSRASRAGTIGVLGPTRMNYPQAMAAVAVVSSRLSDRLTEG